MSVICTVAAGGAVYLSAGALAGVASAAAGALALRRREELESLRAEEGEVQPAEVVELAPRQAEAASRLVAERCHLVFEGEDLRLELDRDIRGKLTVRAHGHGMSREEVSSAAERFLGLLMQQVAYREVVTKMRRYGLEVEQEARLEDGTVKLRIGGGG